MTLSDAPLGGDCPENISTFRRCVVCRDMVDRLTSEHVVVSPSWKRCNDVFCRDCWTDVMRFTRVGVQSVVLFAE